MAVNGSRVEVIVKIAPIVVRALRSVNIGKEHIAIVDTSGKVYQMAYPVVCSDDDTVTLNLIGKRESSFAVISFSSVGKDLYPMTLVDPS